MKRNMKRIMLLLLVGCLFLFMVVGCSGGQDTASSEDTHGSDTGTEQSDQTDDGQTEATVTEAGVFPIVPEDQEPIELTVTTTFDERTPYDESNYAINYIQEKANIKLKFNVLPSADAETKLNLMLSSGDYTDVIHWGFNMDQIVQFGMKEGIFIPLNDLYDKYGFMYKKLFEMRPQYKAKAVAPDGNIYGFISAGECYHCTAYPKLWFNYDWLNKLELQEPQTTDELYAVLKAFKERDPNGNGQADEIPLTGCIEVTCPAEYFLMNSFLPVDFNTFCYSKDGKVLFSPSEPEYKEGLKWIKKLFDEGLIDRANFTQKADQLAQLVRQDPLVVGAYTADHFAMGVDIKNYEVSKMFDSLPPVAGPNGARYQPHTDYVDMVGSFGLVITDKCKYPEVAFRYGDMHYEEDVMMVKTLGKEGNFWGKVKPGTKSIGGGEAKYWARETFGEEDAEKYMHDIFYVGPMWMLKEFRDQRTPMPEDPFDANAYEARLSLATDRVTKYFYPEYLPRSLYMGDVSDEFTELKLNIVNCVKSYTSQFIMGEKDIDKDWESFMNDCESFGLDRYLELYQKAYDEYKSNMAN
jgi:putative aldouronate transport system substrate-binding protein